MDFVMDNCCLCGVGTMGLSTRRRQEDIVFAHYGNEVREGGREGGRVGRGEEGREGGTR